MARYGDLSVLYCFLTNYSLFVQRVSEMVRVRSFLGSAEITPAAKLDKWVSVTKPSQQGKVLPLGSRDVLPDGTRCYQLVIEYEFDQPEDGEVTLRWQGMQGVLYESDFHAQFFMIYDNKKKLLGAGDAFPSAVKITKGPTTVRYQVRHTSVTVLESIADICMLIERPISKSIALSFFKMQTEAMTGTGKMGGRNIAPGSSVSMFIREPTSSQLPKQASPGDYLVGSYTLLKNNTSMLGSGDRPGGFPITYTIGDTKVKTPTTAAAVSKEAGKEKSESQLLEAAIKDAKLKHLKSLSGKNDSFMPLYIAFVAEYPEDLTLHQLQLAHTVKCRDVLKKKSAESPVTNFLACLSVKNAANDVLKLINQLEIAAVLGMNTDKDNAAEAASRKDVETKKAALIEALAAQASAQLDICELVKSLLPIKQDVNETSESVAVGELAVPSGSSDSESELYAYSEARAEQELEEFLTALKRWDDINADKNWLLWVRKQRAQGRWATVFKRVTELLATEKDAANRDMLFEVRIIRLILLFD